METLATADFQLELGILPVLLGFLFAILFFRTVFFFSPLSDLLTQVFAQTPFRVLHG